MFSLSSKRHQQLMKSEETIMIKVKINGQEQNWDGDPDLPLLWFLRDEVGLDRHQIRLRPGALRRMHRDRRQAGGPRLHHLGFRCGRPRGHHHRRPSSHRRSCGAEGLAPGQRPAMRLLPGRPDHAGRGAARRKIPNPPTIRYARRWRAISAAAAVTSASKTPSISPRRGSDHEHPHKSRQASRL